MDSKSAMAQLRGCPEAFLWISQHLNGFTYNLQKCVLSLWKLRAGVSLSYAPRAAQVTSHRARSQLSVLLLIPVIAVPSVVLRNQEKMLFTGSCLTPLVPLAG